MGTSTPSRALCLMVSALLLFCPVIIALERADAAFNPIPVLTLSLHPTQLEAAVSDTQNGPVMFYGNATVEMTPFLKVTVTLSASCIWPAIISPSTMTFDSSVPQQFYVTVVVPPKTSSLEVGTLIVSGTAKAPGISIVTASANAVVTVHQYFRLEVAVLGGPFQGLQPGGTVTGKLVVNNTGNGLDSITIELLDPQGVVSARDMRRGFDLKQGESEEVPFTLVLNESLGKTGNFSRDIAFACTSQEAFSRGIDYTQTTWCTLSFGGKKAGTSGEVPPGGGGDDGGSTAGDDGSGFPVAIMVVVLLIVVLSVVISYLGRDRARPEDYPEDVVADPPSMGRKA